MFLASRRSKRLEKEEHSQEFFHLVISGRTGAGKTKLLVRLLETEFFKKFNAIYLINPTFEKNASYKSYHTDEKFHVLPGPIENLDYHIDLVRKDCDKYHRSLIILDDVIGTTSVTSRTSKYVNLLIGSRHQGASTITLTQQLNSLSKPARDQMTRLITFYNSNSNDRKILHETFLADTSKEEFKKAMDYLRKNDYSYMDIDILHGSYKLV